VAALTSPTQLAGWELQGLLGSGASSYVFRARRGAVHAAFKVARGSLGVDPVAHFAREAQLLAWLRTPSLPRLLDAGRLPVEIQVENERVAARSPYLVMTLAEGEPLSSWLDLGDAQRSDLCWAVARDVALALADLHAGAIAHGDVKPDNILVTRGETALQCTLIDLGLAGDATRERPDGGTLRYLAPEDLDGSARGNGRARDLYALGLCLLESAVPGVRTAPEDTIEQAPPDLRFVVAALLDRNPAARPSAEWVLAQCPDNVDLARQRESRRRRVEREYLLLRRRELAVIDRGHRVEIREEGTAASWLRSQSSLLKKARTIQGVPESDESHVLAPLTELQQRQWLARLVGSTSLDFPPLPATSDDELADRLLALSEDADPASITYASLLGGSSLVLGDVELSSVEVAVGLGSEAPSDQVLLGLERMLARGDCPLPCILRGARALSRRHELARALRVLAFGSGSRVHLERASVLLRAGDERAARLELDAGERTAGNPAERGDAAAQRARLEISRGRIDAAASALDNVDSTLSVLQARASLALSQGRLGEARRHLEQALGQPHDAEQRARVEALFANLAQREGDAEGALNRFRNAAEHAARARAILEEATYLIGVSGTASTLGRLDVSIDASRRSELLFAYLGQPAAAARAALASAAAFCTAGAKLETRAACERTMRFAREAGDDTCRAYAHLIASDVAEPSDATDHLVAAERLLAPLSDDDELRIAARRLRRGATLNETALDQRAKSRSPDLALEWWAARAETALARGQVKDQSPLVQELLALSHQNAAPDALGPAMAFGAQLAGEIGDGDTARKLIQSATLAWRKLAAGTPPALALTLRERDWVQSVRAPSENAVAPEQVGDLAQLIHGLSERDHLKPLLDRVLDALVLWTGVERGLLLLKAPGGKLVPRAARNVARRDLNPLQIELSRSLAERALERAECVVAADAAGELPDLVHSVHALKLRSVMAVPLIARGETLGVVYLDDRVRRGAFGPRELSWVKLVASLASVAIADARDQLLLKRVARRAARAEARLVDALAKRDAELEVAQRELASTRAKHRYSYPEIVGESPAIQALLALLDRVTPSDVPVLISGESGSGKELVARALALNGPRGNQPFVSENCSAIPETLLESTLFGHVKGAFTGASRNRVGLFEAADGGTLFLDEIADMSLGMQAKLLRALQNGEIRRVGDERSVSVDVRVIGATHKNLTELVRQGRFREDLLYRLNVITVNVPALRDRMDDIAGLVSHFLNKHGGAKVVVSRPALELLRGFAWPGNVRQLENETRRAMVLADGEIRPEHLSPEVQMARPESLGEGLGLRRHVDALESRLVERALNQTEGNQTQAAKLLGVSRFGLQKMMRRLGIEWSLPGR
jgi:serine/threonine-protein kinase PknK